MKRARIQIITAAVCWGFIPVFYHIMSATGLNRMQTITMRFTLAAVGYVLCLLVRDRSLLRIKKPAHLLYFVGTGVCSLAAFNFCYITCIKYAGVATAALLLYTAPAFVLVMGAVFFHEAVTGRSLAALAMTVLGCAMVAGISPSNAALNLSALLWGLGSGFGYALYSVFSKLALRDYSAETITAYTAVFAAAATLPLSHPQELLSISPTALFSGIGCALICTVLAYGLYTAGLTQVPAAQASVLATVEPVVAALLGVLLLQEPMSVQKLCGIALVLGAVALLALPRKVHS